ncbi:hypothetical protein AB0H73_06365 [Streptomyces olivoreticuli]
MTLADDVKFEPGFSGSTRGFHILDRKQPGLLHGYVWLHVTHDWDSVWVAEKPDEKAGNGGGVPGFASQEWAAQFVRNQGWGVRAETILPPTKEVADHYHVGFNLAGHAPQADDVQCVEDADDAVHVLGELLEDQSHVWAERCDNFGTTEWLECSCRWCNLVLNVERARDDIGDDALVFKLRKYGQAGESFNPPVGTSKEFWARREAGERCAV